MKLDRLNSTTEDPNVTFTSRSRALLYAAMAATALSVTACGGDKPNDPGTTGGNAGAAGESGSGGNAGSSETGGTGATETGGEGGETDPCADVECNGNGTCNGGECVCDEGFTDDDDDPVDDCNTCDTGYENYPDCTPVVTDLCAGVDCDDNNVCTADTCDPADGSCDNDPAPHTGDSCDDGNDNTINDECNADGICEGETVECINNTQCDDGNVCNGTETCNTAVNTCENGTSVVCGNNASCEEPGGDCVCDTDMVPSNVNSEDCVPDPCLTETCNDNGTCSQAADDSAECACDTGFAAPDCGSCDTGYYNYPACEVIPPAPVISNLAIDCSSTAGYCFASEPEYPGNFTVSDALNCIGTTELLTGGFGTPSTVSGINLDSINGSFMWYPGSTAGDTIRVNINCTGPGGTDSESVDILQY